jgi:glycerol uptake facilitator-like aquaporin
VSDLAHQPETGVGRLHLDLPRRLVAEALGTGLLLIAVVGSGIMASRLSPQDTGLQLLENAAATAGALVALIWMLGAVSGAHSTPPSPSSTAASGPSPPATPASISSPRCWAAVSAPSSPT